jgi:hypothetical protein
MKAFFRAVINITWLQIFLIIVFAAVRYLTIIYGQWHEAPMVALYIGVGSLVLLLLSLGIEGVLENRQGSFKKWEAEHFRSGKQIIISGIVKWGRFIPLALGTIFFIYFMSSTSYLFALAALGGVIVGNVIKFLDKKNSGKDADAE